MQIPQLANLPRPARMIAVLRELIKRFNRHDGQKTAASLTYTTLFAVVPLTTVLYAMLAAVPEFQGVGEKMQGYLFQQFVPATGEVVLNTLRNFTTQARNLTAVGALFLFVTSLLMMITVEKAFNNIWQVPDNRKGIASFLLYWAVLTLGPILVGTGFVLSSYLMSLTFVSNAASWFGGGKFLLRLLPPLLSFLAFLFLYMAVPNYRVRMRHAAGGALLVSLLLELAKLGFSLYVANFPSYQVIYGAFAAVPLFLLWIYLSWAIVLLGAEVSAWLGETQRADWRHWAMYWQGLGVLMLLDRAHQEGRGAISAAKLRRLLGGRARTLLVLLEEAGWAVPTEEGNWVLAHSLSTLTLWEYNRRMPGSVPDTGQPPEALQEVYRVLQQACECQKAALDRPLRTLFHDVDPEQWMSARPERSFYKNAR
ncbi:YihY family inner membrane protein [Kushneria phosphatilytica]|uniref:UPF0761 membrane protein FY550_08100 n=1 Tax=Kushneria phosphatilytica TaxID=657387 RepID=A0A1S1NX16_9GAMM|nr:YihY family inner membrane protein [Kushneria phosphatilytica]OHV11916.1 hypothetical protein BH688_04355 [Kushneria phosphatilytica]QEL11095.1 YihY family inner membrane protein [Kushneria phosphatilytica]